MTPLERAIKHCGGLVRLAEQLSRVAEAVDKRPVTYQAIQKWHGNGVPADRCRDIEAVTDGEVSRYELRPDIFGPPPAPKREAA